MSVSDVMIIYIGYGGNTGGSHPWAADVD